MDELNKTVVPEAEPAEPVVEAAPAAEPAEPVVEPAAPAVDPAVAPEFVAPAAPAKKKLGTKQIVAIVAAVFVLVAAIFTFGGSIDLGGLSGDDKIAYEIISSVAYKFKDPSSVRIVGGVLGYNDEDNYHYLFCTISAYNSYGKRVSGEYYMTTEGTCIEFESELASKQNDLNLDKINKKLAKKLAL
ncbi:MAG: hypothetical protein E7223_04045 [Clostridiales bacterium]|nr:hypothetical protein [Clostridiales bacterium]